MQESGEIAYCQVSCPCINLRTLADGVLGGRVKHRTSISAEVHGRSHQTVSQSEAGFEKIIQAAQPGLDWIIPGDACTLKIQLTRETRKS